VAAAQSQYKTGRVDFPRQRVNPRFDGSAAAKKAIADSRFIASSRWKIR